MVNGLKNKHVNHISLFFYKNPLQEFLKCIEYAASTRYTKRKALIFITDEVVRRSLRDYEEQLVWIFTG